MRVRILIIDRYILFQLLGTMAAVMGIVIALMTLEHLPRLVEMTRLSGRRGYIIGQTIVGLLPEYTGIGLLVGLYLGITLTVRRLALCGELDVIEACGIGPRRWMRFPLILTVLVTLLVFFNQGWLVPAGEAKLENIGHRMEIGEFGHQLPADQFIDLGAGSVLLFRHIDASTGQLLELFLKTKEATFTAKRGRLAISRTGGTELELINGQAVEDRNFRVTEFAHFRYRVDDAASNMESDEQSPGSKLLDSSVLWDDGSARSRSTVYGRGLWAALTLITPLFALPLGKPPRRQAGGVGILSGIALLVIALKMVNLLIERDTSRPEALAASILISWGVLTFALIQAEKKFGQGFIDLAAKRFVTQNLYWMSIFRSPLKSNDQFPTRRRLPCQIWVRKQQFRYRIRIALISGICNMVRDGLTQALNRLATFFK